MLSGPHQKFAEGIAMGLNATEAYLAAYPDASPQNAAKNTSRLTKNDEITAEVKRLRNAAQNAPGGVVLEIVEKRQILAQIARGGEKDSDRINAIKADNDLAGDGSDAKQGDALVNLMREITSRRGI